MYIFHFVHSDGISLERTEMPDDVTEENTSKACETEHKNTNQGDTAASARRTATHTSQECKCSVNHAMQ